MESEAAPLVGGPMSKTAFECLRIAGPSEYACSSAYAATDRGYPLLDGVDAPCLSRICHVPLEHARSVHVPSRHETEVCPCVVVF